MKIIVCEVLGVVETYKDSYNMPREWHLNQLQKITETAHILRYTDANSYFKKTVRADYIKLLKMQRIEDLFFKAKFEEKFNYRIEKTIKDFNA